MKEFGKSLMTASVLGVSFGFAYGLAIEVADKICDWLGHRKEKEVFDVPQEED